MALLPHAPKLLYCTPNVLKSCENKVNNIQGCSYDCFCSEYNLQSTKKDCKKNEVFVEFKFHFQNTPPNYPEKCYGCVRCECEDIGWVKTCPEGQAPLFNIMYICPDCETRIPCVRCVAALRGPNGEYLVDSHGNRIPDPGFIPNPCSGSLDPCCGSTDPNCCDGSSNLCCGNPDPICQPCGGPITDLCCGSEDPCCGKLDGECNPCFIHPHTEACDPCFESEDPCCGSKNPCCGNEDPCCGSQDPCCGSTDPCCGDPNPCCGNNTFCCHNTEHPSCGCNTDVNGLCCEYPNACGCGEAGGVNCSDYCAEHPDVCLNP